jgi:hypothetical protein
VTVLSPELLEESSNAFSAALAELVHDLGGPVHRGGAVGSWFVVDPVALRSPVLGLVIVRDVMGRVLATVRLVELEDGYKIVRAFPRVCPRQAS